MEYRPPAHFDAIFSTAIGGAFIGLAALVSTIAAEKPDRTQIAAAMARAPILDAGTKVGEPLFKVIRLNESPSDAPDRIAAGMVRIHLPDTPPKSMALLFSDSSNLAEYQLISVETGTVVSGNTRAIIPAMASLEIDGGGNQPPPNLRLPRPWDLFELHILGFPSSVLKAGADYILWFRFSDRRPTDLLFAVTLLDPATSLDPGSLPGVMALPAELAR